MGYKKQSRIYKLVFDDPDYEGLEVRAKSLSIGKMRKFMRDRDSDDEAAMEKSLEVFEGCLVSWNLEEEDGTPVPPNREGFDSLDVDFVMHLISVWMETITGVPDESPLHGKSSGGAQSLEASIPMEPLSASRAS